MYTKCTYTATDIFAVFTTLASLPTFTSSIEGGGGAALMKHVTYAKLAKYAKLYVATKPDIQFKINILDIYEHQGCLQRGERGNPPSKI